jgi:hypothetical protein
LIHFTTLCEVWTDGLPMAGPDPILSANVYCRGRLSEVISRLVEPCWEEFKSRASAAGCYLWIMRYTRRGEHLKIRFHGPESFRACFHELLEAAQERYFSQLGCADEHDQSSNRVDCPPIDVEDSVATDQPDRTFLWTTYTRSPLSLGYPPFLEDDSYVYLLTSCLARATEILLRHLRSGDPPFPLQRELLLKAVITGLTALPLSDSDRLRYLLYHRDTLLRFLWRRKNQGLELTSGENGAVVMARVLNRLDEWTESIGTGHNNWSESPFRQWEGQSAWGADFNAWGWALNDLCSHITPQCRALDQRLDPFAELPTFPLFFKAFHGFANQVGLDHLNEASVYHSLAYLPQFAGYASFRSPVQLVPNL